MPAAAAEVTLRVDTLEGVSVTLLDDAGSDACLPLAQINISTVRSVIVATLSRFGSFRVTAGAVARRSGMPSTAWKCPRRSCTTCSLPLSRYFLYAELVLARVPGPWASARALRCGKAPC